MGERQASGDMSLVGTVLLGKEVEADGVSMGVSFARKESNSCRICHSRDTRRPTSKSLSRFL